MQEEKQTTEGAPIQDDAADLADPAALLAALTSERDQLAKERAELYDQLLRRSADLDNIRRRSQRERAEYAEYAGMEAVGQILPVLDDFERALKMDAGGKEYSKGVELIYNRLIETLKKLGLEPLAAAGERFDTNLHHAVEMVSTTEAEDQTVLEELQRGYNFKGRLLRPAMVRVASRP
jgi:molecular chaperone GrpE